MFIANPSLVEIGWLGCALRAMAVWVAGCCMCIGIARAAQKEPTASELVQARFADIEKEIARLNAAGQRGEAEAMQGKLKYFRERMEGKAKSTSTEPELHLVGFYNSTSDGRERAAGTIEVEVQASDRPMIVALSCYERARWKVSVMKGAAVRQVLVGSYSEQRLEIVPGNIPVQISTATSKTQPFFCFYDDHQSLLAAGRVLKTMTGLDIATAQVMHNNPGQRVIIGPGSEEWVAQRVLREIEPLHREAIAFIRAQEQDRVRFMRFKAIEFTSINPIRPTAGQWCDFSPLGPIGKAKIKLPDNVTRLAVDPRGPVFYGFRRDLVRFNLDNGEFTPIPMDDFDLPSLVIPSAITYDTKRRTVIVGTLGGEGFLYSYSPDQNKWSLLRSLNQVDLCAMAYAPEIDCYYALSTEYVESAHRLAVCQYDTAGLRKHMALIQYPLPEVLGRIDSGLQIASVGRVVAVLTPPRPDLDLPPQCLLIDPRTGIVHYSGIVEPQPDAPLARLTARELLDLWEQMLGPEDQAETAMWKLASAGDETIALMRKGIRPTEQIDDSEIEKMIGALDADDFAARDRATVELMRLGSIAESVLQKAGRNPASPEARARIERILASFNEQEQTDPAAIKNEFTRREARAVWVLARMGTPAAVEFLKELARGGNEPRTIHARSALRSLR